MRRGTELMAAAPTGWSSPRFVTRPTPAPPSIVTPGVSVRLDGRQTRAVSCVTSGSSPLSLRMAQETVSRGSRDLEHVQRQGDALGREQIDGSFFVAGQEHLGRRFCRSSGAGAGRIAETESFSVLDDVFFHLSAGSGRASRCRSRRRHCCRPCARARRYRARGSSR